MKSNNLKHWIVVIGLIITISGISINANTLMDCNDPTILAAPIDSISMRAYYCDEAETLFRKVCESTTKASLCEDDDECNDCTGDPRECSMPN